MITENRKTVGDLIKELEKQDKNAILEIAVSNPKDTAYTRADIEVRKQDDVVQIRGFIWSDDEEACCPWARSEFE
jgi:hypothetical protein